MKQYQLRKQSSSGKSTAKRLREQAFSDPLIQAIRAVNPQSNASETRDRDPDFDAASAYLDTYYPTSESEFAFGRLKDANTPEPKRYRRKDFDLSPVAETLDSPGLNTSVSRISNTRKSTTLFLLNRINPWTGENCSDT